MEDPEPDTCRVYVSCPRTTRVLGRSGKNTHGRAGTSYKGRAYELRARPIEYGSKVPISLLDVRDLEREPFISSPCAFTT